MTRRMTFCLPFTAIIFAVAGLSTFSETNAALIRFRSRVVVAGRIITLGDIAEVTDPDSAVIARLQRIPLSPAPAAGRERRIAYETVRSRLSAVGVNLAEVEFSGNSVVTVSVAKNKQKPINPVGRVAERVPAWKIKRAEQLLAKGIGQYVARRAPQTGSVTVAVQLAGQDVSRVLDGWTYGFELRGGTGDLMGTQVLNLRVMDRHSRIHEMAVRCIVTPVPRIVVARSALPSGHVIQPADLTWRQAEAGSRGFTRMEAVVNKETRKPIRQGARILAEDIHTVPLVRPNEIVTVRSRVGGIVVTSRMKSRTAGTLDETVTLVTLDGRRRVEARVSGYHEAEVLAVGSAVVARRAEMTGRVRFQRLPPRPQVGRRGVSSRSGLSGFRPGGLLKNRTRGQRGATDGLSIRVLTNPASRTGRQAASGTLFQRTAGRTDRSIRPVSVRAAVPDRTMPRSGLSPGSGLRRVSETEGVSEWRSLEPGRAIGRTARAADGKSDRRIKPVR